jgi:peptidoglycan/LPS O-acetylase OafA/YrhL
MVLFESMCGIPLFCFSVVTMYENRTLTVATALYMAFVCSALVAVGAALFWYTFSKPLLTRRGAK